MQVGPDWSKLARTASQLEDEIGNGFKFLGPGLYCDEKETVLIMKSGVVFGDEKLWTKVNPPETLFDYHHYGVQLYETVLSIGHIPCRKDLGESFDKLKQPVAPAAKPRQHVPGNCWCGRHHVEVSPGKLHTVKGYSNKK